MRAYVAGPLFSESERQWDERINEVLVKAGCDVFLPHRDSDPERRLDPKEIFSTNLKALEGADLVVCNLDGADVDSGTAWEIGYAVARGKSIIGLRTDFRKSELGLPVNLMVAESVFLVDSLEKLGRAVEAFIENTPDRG